MYVYVCIIHTYIFISHTDIARADAADVLDVAGGSAQAGGRAGIAIAGGGAGEAAVGVGGRHVGDVGGGGVDDGRERHGDAGICEDVLELLFGAVWRCGSGCGLLACWSFGGEAGRDGVNEREIQTGKMDGWMDG